MKNKNVLICPLNWGLGHATRCIPLIEQFEEAGYTVFLGSDGASHALLRKEFPHRNIVQLPSYDISYPNDGKIMKHMLKNMFHIFKRIKAENTYLKHFIKQYNIDIVVSDNRYGMWNKNVYSIFLTHQLFIQFPKNKLIERIILRVNKLLMSRFDEIWVPDFKRKPYLSGKLSHKKRLKNVRFIGPLTRFNQEHYSEKGRRKYRILAIISGPEPQRTQFEDIVVKQLDSLNINAAVISGKPDIAKYHQKRGKISLFSHLDTKSFAEVLSDSDVIICRSGYSTIMDLAAFGKKAILIPTPGQTEQEYLAEFFLKHRVHYTMKQDELDISEALVELRKFKGIMSRNKFSYLNKRIHNLKNLNRQDKKKS
ncbi:MAG: hypothetical protein JEZ03_03745 [Bacteroidales bacterium]|nr:hypothetical protein [Bacteroidales bacterium]